MSEVKKFKTQEEINAELQAAELELKQLEIAERRANLQDIKERLNEREVTRQTKTQRAVTNGQAINATKTAWASQQSRCNHRKGGNGADGIVAGQGDDAQYAVIKHRMQNGDVWVRCLRCGKTWKPPIEEDFYFDKNGKSVAVQDGTFDKEAFQNAVREYTAAVAFQTRNSMSGSITFQYSDGGKYFRQVMRHTDLR